MDLAINALEKDIVELRDQIEFVKDIVLEPSSPSYQYSRSNSKKKFEYRTIIISLYGIVEYHIEQFCFAYIESIEKYIPKYELLEEKFRDKHFNQSIQLMNKIIEGKHAKYERISKELILQNLNICLEPNSNYRLNKEAFTINSGNLKHSKICELIGLLSINLGEKLRKANIYQANSENRFNFVDDLVDRRNEIAHGSDIEMLDISVIFPLVDSIKEYLFSIGQVLQAEIYFHKKENHCTIIDSVEVYPGGSIIGIHGGDSKEFEINDELLVERDDGTVFLCIILEIKIQTKGVTLKLDKKIKDNQTFYKCKKVNHL